MKQTERLLECEWNMFKSCATESNPTIAKVAGAMQVGVVNQNSQDLLSKPITSITEHYDLKTIQPKKNQ